jgi:hypothetical protein
MNKPVSETGIPYYSNIGKAGQPKHLNHRHLALLREINAGTKLQDAARIHNYTLNRASIIMHSPQFQTELIRLRTETEVKHTDLQASDNFVERARTLLINEVEPSIRKVVKLRDCAESENVQATCALEILDRVGLNKVEKVKIDAKMNVSEDLIFALNMHKPILEAK